jgi:hypothetical protein
LPIVTVLPESREIICVVKTGPLLALASLWTRKVECCFASASATARNVAKAAAAAVLMAD